MAWSRDNMPTWSYRCKHDNESFKKCALIDQTECLISIEEMPIPKEYWGYCWITKEPVLFVLEDVQE